MCLEGGFAFHDVRRVRVEIGIPFLATAGSLAVTDADGAPGCKGRVAVELR